MKAKGGGVQAPQEAGYLSRLGTGFKERFDKASAGVAEAQAGRQSSGSAVLQTTGQIAGAVFDPLTEGISTGLKATGLDKPLGSAIGAISENKTLAKVAEATGVQAITDYYMGLSQEAKDNIDAVFNIGSLIPASMLIKPVAGAVKTGIKAGVETVADITSAVSKTVAPVVGGAVDVAKAGIKGVAGIPSRIATNVATKQAEMAVVRTLPTKVARQAAQDGIDVNDVSFLYKTPKASKPAFQKLAKVAKEFAEDPRKQNPIEIVGQPLVSRIKELESARGTIGQKLGEVADTLGVVTTKEVAPTIISSLQKVEGLSGLTVSKKGILNFDNTTLALTEAASDRKAIQQLFFDAVKNGSGKQKHLLRQGLWEILGGKKGKIAVTGTQEKAYAAIRKGLSDVLDTKNSTYKSLNKEFAKVAQPLSDMRKFMKSTSQGGIDDDILNMKAGVLARRLTGASPSGSDIRAILSAMDKATAVKGQSFDEGVKGQGDVAFHGTQSKEIRGTPNVTRGSFGRAFYLTNDAERAANFGKDVRIKNPSGALLRKPDQFKESNVFAFDTSGLKIKEFVNDADLYSKVEDQDISAWARLSGWDGIKIKSSNTTAIYRPEKLKLLGTPSQLRAKFQTALNATKGQSRISVENLQDFYNILNKYYDIAGKTSFQGQIKLAGEGGTNILDIAGKALKATAGQTPAVRQKALERILEEALR